MPKQGRVGIVEGKYVGQFGSRVVSRSLIDRGMSQDYRMY